MTLDLEFRLCILVLLASIKLSRWWIHCGEAKSTDPEAIDLRDAGLSMFYIVPTELVILLYLVFPSSIAWAGLPFADGIRWLGLVPGLFGLALFAWAHRSLGPDFSVFLRPREEHRLIVDGPYRWVRHPIYSAAFLVALGFLLLSANGLVGLVWLGGASLFFGWRIPREEAMMIVRFDGPYLEHMKTTGSLWPRWRPGTKRPTYHGIRDDVRGADRSRKPTQGR